MPQLLPPHMGFLCFILPAYPQLLPFALAHICCFLTLVPVPWKWGGTCLFSFIPSLWNSSPLSVVRWSFRHSIFTIKRHLAIPIPGDMWHAMAARQAGPGGGRWWGRADSGEDRQDDREWWNSGSVVNCVWGWVILTSPHTLSPHHLISQLSSHPIPSLGSMSG